MKVAVPGIAKYLKNYLAALEGVGLEPVIALEPAEIGGFAGLLLPGGGDIEPALYGEENRGSGNIDRPLDERQLAMTDAFVRAGRPVLGICKGLQVLNVYFGGGIIQHLATAELHRRANGDAVHACVSLPGGDMDRLYGRRYAVNSMHHQAAGRLGQGLLATSFSPDGAVESLRHETLPVFAVQWHPERMCFAKARPDTVDGAAIFWRFRSMLEADGNI